MPAVRGESKNLRTPVARAQRRGPERPGFGRLGWSGARKKNSSGAKAQSNRCSSRRHECLLHPLHANACCGVGRWSAL